MVRAGADLCVALHRSISASKGTKDCVRKALAARISVYRVIDRWDQLNGRLGPEIIARYERLHGAVQSAGGAPKQRQPIIDRWVITDGAFAQVHVVVGSLRLREEFSSPK
jgi:hypothetical protein